MQAVRNRRDADRREILVKALFVVCGVPVATWIGIFDFWSGAYYDGKVPYYVGAATMLRGMFELPLQMLTTGLLLFFVRRLLSHTGWLVILLACVFACIGAHQLEAWANQRDDLAGLYGESSPWVDRLGPHLVGMAVLAMLACSGLVARRGGRSVP